MKKALVLILSIIMVCSSFLLTGCGKREENPTIINKMRENSKKIEASYCSSVLSPNEDVSMNEKKRWINSFSEYKALNFESWIEGELDIYSMTTSADEDEIKEYEEHLYDTVDEYNVDFFEENNLLLIEFGAIFWGAEIEDICLDEGMLEIYIRSSSGLPLPETYYLFFVPVSKTDSANIKGVDVTISHNNDGSYADMGLKPIIYLYPEEETDVNVRLGYKDKIIVSYPEYVDGWSVLAKPDGKLVYNETGRKLYSLYYESENAVKFKIEKDGFVVKGEDIAPFLEEKLAILGLNEYEMEEFIIYWLPVLQANEYNYIRFATAEEIEHNMPLEIDPNPDTIIRVLMTYKRLDAPIEVEEQKLTTPKRTGFVAVEWGGSEIK